jgi:hypothetical protein
VTVTTQACARLGGRARRRLGHRGASLLVLGIFDALYAAHLPGSAATHTPTWLWMARLAPLTVWAAIWAAIGVVLIIGAFREHDRWAFAAAIALKVMWATVYLIGVFNDVPRAWGPSLIWTLFATWVLIISTWPERQWPAA